jgi:hypothetical protein
MTSHFQTYNHPDSTNTALIDSALPTLSFAEFKAWKLRGCEISWINSDLVNELGISMAQAEKEILVNYAYVSEDYTESKRLKLSDSKTFLADRYGSRYEACNGGSARCGSNGNYQIKGIGRNPLVAGNIDYNHSHGKMCLSEAINEAVWGEVCHQHLPLGAIRTLAIIKTNVMVKSSYGKGDLILQPCALAIRQVSVRPAHFERAVFFWPQPEFKALRDNDYLRVQHTISYIDRAFNVTAEDKARFGSHTLKCALLCFAERIARQIGVSRIKGIPHGSLTSSNISLDGRFLDFGTISAVPDFANYVLAGGQGGVWDDHLLIAQWIRHLSFFLNKYSTEKLTDVMLNEVVTFFLNELDISENIETAKQLGFKGNLNKLAHLGGQFKAQLRKNNEEPRNFHGFNGVSLKTQIQNASIKLGIAVPKVNFDLRNPKFSQYTILTDELVKRSGGSRKAITALIASYTQDAKHSGKIASQSNKKVTDYA